MPFITTEDGTLIPTDDPTIQFEFDEGNYLPALIEQQQLPDDDPLADLSDELALNQELQGGARSLDDLLAENPLEDDPYAVAADAQINEEQLLVGLEGGDAIAAAAALKNRAQAQQSLRSQQSQQASAGDWRVKLRLAPGANYLYKAGANGADSGILQPLAVTDGVVFPYTPRITTSYHAVYSTYDLTHANYRGAFYQNSHVGDVNIEAVFTAQDTYEANYLLAVIHFFRSATKMFYGQDPMRGTPPPLVFLEGLGQYQFNLHPCVIKDFNYSLPDDVDYIRARVDNNLGQNQLMRRDRQTTPTNVFAGALQRLMNAGLPKGGMNKTPAPATLGTKNPTYVPTKISLSIVLLPMQSRQQVSQQFSLQSFANGDLIKKGFW